MTNFSISHKKFSRFFAWKIQNEKGKKKKNTKCEQNIYLENVTLMFVKNLRLNVLKYENHVEGILCFMFHVSCFLFRHCNLIKL